MIELGILAVFCGVMLAIMGIYIYKQRVKKLSDWFTAEGNVISKEFIIGNAVAFGWKVTIHYYDKNGDTCYFTPKIVTFPFPIGFFRAPIIVYNENRKVCLKSTYMFFSKILFYISFLVTLIGSLHIIQILSN